MEPVGFGEIRQKEEVHLQPIILGKRRETYLR